MGKGFIPIHVYIHKLARQFRLMPVTLILQTNEASPAFKIDKNCLKTDKEFYTYSKIVLTDGQTKDSVNAYLAGLKYKSQKRIVVFKLDADFGLQSLLPTFKDKQSAIGAFYTQKTGYGEQLIDPYNCTPSIFQDMDASFRVLNISKVGLPQAVSFLETAPQNTLVKYMQFSEKNDIVELVFDGFLNTFCVESMLERMARSNHDQKGVLNTNPNNGMNEDIDDCDSRGYGENDCVATKLLYNLFCQARKVEPSNSRYTFKNSTSFDHIEVIISCSFQDSDQCWKLLKLGSMIKLQEDALHGVTGKVPILQLAEDTPLEEYIRILKGKYEKTAKMHSREYANLSKRERQNLTKLKNKRLRELMLNKCDKQAELEKDINESEKCEFMLGLSASKLTNTERSQDFGALIASSLFSGIKRPDTCSIELEKGKLMLELASLCKPTHEINELCNAREERLVQMEKQHANEMK